MFFLTKTQKETAQFIAVIATALAAAALIIVQPANANDSAYLDALSNAQSECRAIVGSDGDPAAHRRCVEITLHDTYGYGTPIDPPQTQSIPLETTPWGVYREPAEVVNAFQLQ